MNIANSPSVNFKGALKTNLRAGEVALKSFKKEFPCLNSPSLWNQRIDRTYKKTGEFPVYLAKIYGVIKKYEYAIWDLRKKTSQPEISGNFLKELKIIKKEMRKTNCGNCGEISIVLYDKLRKNKLNPKAVQVDMLDTDTDHVFCVIGLKKGADIKNPKTWGENAVVVDGWKNFVLRAQDAMIEYENLYGEKTSSMCFHNIDYNI